MIVASVSCSDCDCDAEFCFDGEWGREAYGTSLWVRLCRAGGCSLARGTPCFWLFASSWRERALCIVSTDYFNNLLNDVCCALYASPHTTLS